MEPTICARCKKNVAVVFLTRMENGKNVQGYIPREQLMRAQTPITFRMKDLKEIARLTEEKGIGEKL